MCGISGFINSNKKTVDESVLQTLLQVQHHRGPDAAGIYYDSFVGLAHNRLSLLDLTENGNQPFEDAEHVLIYNGEIYNYEELRAMLPPKDYQSSSDTAVLFHALKTWGVDKAIKSLRGMFAFAWYDKKSHNLTLGRDRIGIKPLFYGADTNGTYCFASEIKSILAVIKGQVNPIKVLYSGLGVLEKSRYETAWCNIFQVKPGSYISISQEKVTETIYHDLAWDVDENEFKRLDKLSFGEVLNEFEGLFNSAIKKMLISDAPMGVYVSGGIDSSLIAVRATAYQPDLKLFTANVKGKYSEFADAEFLAECLGKKLYDYPFEKEMALRDWAKVTWHYESPLVIHFNAIPFSNVSQLAYEEKVKAVLTGEGADELFLGYPKLLTRKYDKMIKSPFALLTQVYNTIPKLKSYVFNTGGSQDLLGLFEQAAQNFTRQTIREKDIGAYDFLPEKARQEQYLTAQMMREGIISLLWRNDRMGMINSIEARFPFLDEKITAFAMNLPVKFKIGRTKRFHNYKHPFLIDKYIVRKLAEKNLPHRLTYKKKNGFPSYGLRHTAIKPEFFKNGFLAEMMQLNDKQVEYMCGNFTSYNIALLGSVEVWAKLFLGNETIEQVSESINRNFSIN